MSRIITFSKKKSKDLLTKRTRLAKKAENANTKKEKANLPILKKDLNAIIEDITIKIKKELTTEKQINSKAPVVGKKIQAKKPPNKTLFGNYHL
jgi:phosphohistidine swiveling domain-containing protein